MEAPPLQLPLFPGVRQGERLAASPAALFDAVYEPRREDVRVYLALAAAAKGPVLELGAGTGRLLAPLLATSIDATGLERDADALELGRTRLAALGGSRFSRRLIEGDMTRFELGRRYALIVLACNTLSLLLEDGALLGMLRGVRRHLEPTGAFVFDVSMVEGHSWRQPPHAWHVPAESVWVAGAAATTTETGKYDPATRRCRVLRDFQLADGRSARMETETRQRTIEELFQHLRAAGLEPDSAVDERGGPLDDASTLAFVRSVPARAVG